MKKSTEKNISFLKRTASEVITYRVRMKILSILLVLLTTFTGVIYVAAALYEQSGSFTVSVDKTEMMKYGLSLSETRDMDRSIVRSLQKKATRMLPPLVYTPW